MKKLIALFVALVLCLGMVTTAFAEETETAAETETISVTWEKVEAIVEEEGLEGEFITLDEVGLQLWLPTMLEEVELDEEDIEANGFIAYFTNEDETASLGITVNEAGTTPEEYIEYLNEIEVQNLQPMDVNGAEFISYTYTNDDDVQCNVVTLIDENGNILEFAFTAGDEEYETISAYIVASIQPAESAEADETAEADE